MSDVKILGLEAAFERHIHRLPGGRVVMGQPEWAHLCRLLSQQGVVPNPAWGYVELLGCLRALDRRRSRESQAK